MPGLLLLRSRIKNISTDLGKYMKNEKMTSNILLKNEDGSVCAKIPLRWVKINPGSKNRRVMTEEQKEAARIRLAEARKKMKKK